MKQLIAVIIIVAIGMSIAIFMIAEEQEKRILPIINPTDVNPALVDSSLHNKGVNHTISPFSLINQDGQQVSQELVKGKILVANFFFTTCPTVCPKMNNRLKKVHDHYQPEDQLIILSHTVWPEVDSIPLLKAYSEQYEANNSRWQFLTGDKKHLYDLARKSYLVAPSVNDPFYDHGGEGDFIHTENIVLVDQKGRIRGFYDGLSDRKIEQLIADIALLLPEN